MMTVRTFSIRPLTGQQLFRSIGLTAAVLLLTSCSDSDPDNPDSDQTPPSVAESEQYPTDVDADDRPGVIVTGVGDQDSRDVPSRWLLNTGTFRLASRTPGTGDGFVSLFDYGEDGITVARHIEFYEPDIDICDVEDNSPDPIGEGGGGVPPTGISGGATIAINSPAGPWFLYDRGVDEDGEIFYETDNGLPDVLPEGATLSIPGDAFPAVAAHPLFTPPEPVRLLPDVAEPLTAESEYSWIPGPSSGYMVVDFLSYDDLGRFAGFVGRCEMTDDGSFAMPQRVRDFIAASPNRIEARYARVYQRIDVIDDMVIRQRATVAE